MNSFTLPASSSKTYRSVNAVGDIGAAALAVILAVCVAGALTFAVIVPSGLGLYCSLGIGALTIDPLRRWLSRGGSSRRG